MAICLVLRTVKGNRHVVTPCKQPSVYRPGGCDMRGKCCQVQTVAGLPYRKQSCTYNNKLLLVQPGAMYTSITDTGNAEHSSAKCRSFCR